MVDVVLCTLPKVEPLAPLVGPALLKALAKNAGFTAQCVDLNIDLWTRLNETHSHIWQENDLTFSSIEHYRAFCRSHFNEILDQWAEKLLKINAEWIGLCAFSSRSEFPIHSLCNRIKIKNPKQKILVGGPYAKFCGPHLLSSLLIDHFIIGDAEKAFIELLQKNPEFKGPQQNQSFDQTTTPDFSDTDFSLYKKTDNERILYYTSSRGCVQNCSFCDVKSLWPKFVFKKGPSVAKELSYLHEKYKIDHFYFTDSLVNGAQNEFVDFCHNLSKKNKINFTWRGQFILRNQSATHSELFKYIKTSGCTLLYIGFESGSEDVRKHMGKHLTDADIEFNLKQLWKHQITFGALLMVGYPTETDEDFQKTLDLVEKLKAYRSIVDHVSIGYTFHLLPGAPLWKELSGQWKNNQTNLSTRVHRLHALREKAKGSGFFVRDPLSQQLELQLSQTDKKQNTLAFSP